MKKEEIEVYRKKQIKDVELPSGMKVQVRNISNYVMLKVREELGIKLDDAEAYSAKLIDKLFEIFLVSPKIPDEFAVLDFNKEDYELLHEMIFNQINFESNE
jgi:hypothetical protein